MHAVRLLVALFLAAQFAGVISSPLAHPHAPSAAVTDTGYEQAGAQHADKHHAGKQADKRHAAGHRHDGCAHPNAGACADAADYCCALHAFFAGILPPAAAIDKPALAGEILRPAVTSVALGLRPGRLDRPPRSLS